MLLSTGADRYEDQPWLLAKQLGFEKIAALLPPSFNEFFILQLLKFFNYPFTEKGICLGFAYLARDIVQSENVAAFNHLLIQLCELFLEIEKETLEALKIKWNMENYQDKKFQYVFKKYLERKLTSIKHNNTQFYVDIYAFLDAIYLYRCHPNFSGIYPSITYTYSNKAAQQTLKILNPQNADIEYRGEWSGAYLRDECEHFFLLLGARIKSLNFVKPISFVLVTPEHAINVSYDVKRRQWILGNSGTLPLQWMDAKEISAKVKSIFSKNEVSIFKTSLYADKIDREKVTKLMSALLKDAAWLKLHAVTYERTQLTCIGKTRSFKWQTLASGKELQAIHKILPSHQFLPIKVLDKFSLFMANKTIGSYKKEYDEKHVAIPLYQKI